MNKNLQLQPLNEVNFILKSPNRFFVLSLRFRKFFKWHVMEGLKGNVIFVNDISSTLNAVNILLHHDLGVIGNVFEAALARICEVYVQVFFCQGILVWCCELQLTIRSGIVWVESWSGVFGAVAIGFVFWRLLAVWFGACRVFNLGYRGLIWRLLLGRLIRFDEEIKSGLLLWRMGLLERVLGWWGNFTLHSLGL